MQQVSRSNNKLKFVTYEILENSESYKIGYIFVGIFICSTFSGSAYESVE